MELKFVDVIGFRTEDPKYPTTNLLRGGKWLCEKKTPSSVNDVTLQLDKVYVINAIDIGNCGSAFVSVEVSRIGLNRYETLLPSTEFMTARDGQTKKNWNSVQMFSEEHFSLGVRQQKWDLVRVVCMQPFLHQEQFGLSFLKVFSASLESPCLPQPQATPPLWSVFAKIRSRSMERLLPVSAKRSEQLLQAAVGHEDILSLDSSPHKTLEKKIVSGNSLLQDKSHDSIGQSHRLHSDKKTDSRQTVSIYSQQQNVNSSAVETQGCLLPPSLKNALSPARVHGCQISPLSRSPQQKTSVTSASTHYRQKKEPQQVFNKDGVCSKKLCVRGNGRIMHIPTSVGKETDRDAVEVVDSDSDSVVDVLSDDDVSTVVIAPVPGCRGEEVSGPAEGVGLSPSRLQRDFESDEETVILSLPKPRVKVWSQGTAVEQHESPGTRLQALQTLFQDNKGEWETVVVSEPSRIPCPLCSELFDVSSIEQHASTCGVETEPELTVCPICMLHFPPAVLIRHADLCAEKSLKPEAAA